AEGGGGRQLGFRALWGALPAFRSYVALSNRMYAISMQASLTVQNIHNVFAPWDARVIQHVLLYPLFILSMRGALRTGWQPLWRGLPPPPLCAPGFAGGASPPPVPRGGPARPPPRPPPRLCDPSPQEEGGRRGGRVYHEG